MAIPVKFKKFDVKRNFGVEIEMGNAISGNAIVAAIRKVDKEREIRLTQAYAQDSGNKFWHVKLDHSCGDKVGDYGWEIASYKACGVKDIANIGNCIKSVQDAGGKVNERCALHVHVDVSDFSGVALRRLVAYWSKIEPYFCHSVPIHRSNNKYCKFVRTQEVSAYAMKQDFDLNTFWDMVRPLTSSNDYRRKTLNICNVCFGSRPTVEFRFPESTLEEVEIKNWVRIFLLFVSHIKKMPDPENLEIVKTDKLLHIIGFQDFSEFYVLSDTMRNLKIWFLNRICYFGRSNELKKSSKEEMAMEKIREQ